MYQARSLRRTIERCRPYSRGFLPVTPMGRLLGCRTAHVAAGTITLPTPASDAMYGLRLEEFSENRAVLSMPAS